MKLARELTGRREHESLAVQFKASLNASERTFIRMMTRIMQIVIANPLPRAPKAGKFGIILYNEGLAKQERAVGKHETIGLASIFGGTTIY
jgi:hypothetical protein